MAEILRRTKINHCYAILTDSQHFQHIFYKALFERTKSSKFLIQIEDNEDLQSPNYQTIKVLKYIKQNDCDLIFILLLNGLQARRFFNFIDHNRILSVKMKYVVLYDHRIFETNMLYIWRKFISILFIKEIPKSYGTNFIR